MKRLLIVALLISIQAWASRKDEITLVMVPDEARTQQIGLDLAKRYPTLLVCYKKDRNGAVLLHGWSGTRWVTLSMADFKSGAFFKKGPSSALLVEKKGQAIAEFMVPGDWCAEIYKITTTDPRVLLHLVGQYYDFKYKEWEWFAQRYGETVDRINPEGLNVSWYHRRLNDRTKPRSEGEDLQYWELIRAPVQAQIDELPEEPVEVSEPLSVEVSEPLPVEVPNDPEVDPFSSEVPAAVVIGAEDVTAVEGND